MVLIQRRRIVAAVGISQALQVDLPGQAVTAETSQQIVDRAAREVDHLLGQLPATPGVLLRRWLRDTGTSQTALAERLGVHRLSVHRLTVGFTSFGPARALELEEVTGIPAIVWVVLQARADLDREISAFPTT